MSDLIRNHEDADPNHSESSLCTHGTNEYNEWVYISVDEEWSNRNSHPLQMRLEIGATTTENWHDLVVLTLRTKTVTCHFSKWRMLWPESHQPSRPPMCPGRDLRWRTRYWPYKISMLIKGMISTSPPSCILPYRKALQSLTWDVCFCD